MPTGSAVSATHGSGVGRFLGLDRLPLFIATSTDATLLSFDAQVNALLGAGHFLSHFYQLCLPPVFIAWQKAFDVSFEELGAAMAVMSAAAALLQTPMGFLVDRYGARPFLVGGTLLRTLSISAMGLTTA